MTALCNHATTSVRNINNRSLPVVVVVVMMMIKAMMYQQRTTVVAFRGAMVGISSGRQLQRSIQVVQQPKATATRLWSSKDVADDSFVDPSGRRIRSRGGGGGGNGWDDNNDSNNENFDNDGWSSSSRSSRKAPAKTRTSSSSSSSWDDFDPWQEKTKGGGRGGDDGDDSGWGGDRPQRQRNDNVGWDGTSGGGTPRRQPRPRDDNGWGGGGSSGRPERQRTPQRRRGDDSSYNPRVNNRNNRFDEDNNNRRPRRSRFDSNNDFEQRGGPPRNGARNKNKFDRKDKDSASGVRSINMNALEGAGFVHLYGLSSILNALSTDRRDLSINVEKTDSDSGGMVVDDPRFQNDNKSDDTFDPDFDDVDDDDDDDEEGFGQGARMPAANNYENDNVVKPQAQFRSYLFVQERKEHLSSRDTGSSRKGNKATAAQQVLDLAEARGVPVAYVDKGILNALSGNRPHQGYVLRCGKLYFEGMSRIPLPDSDSSSMPSLWLVLDEVVDPQNLGALLRSAYFLGGRGGTATGENNIGKIGVLVCSKNSAPPSPVVSASSAGALELLDVYSTTNLPRTLNQAAEDGFRIIGASSSIPTTGSNDDDGEQGGPQLYDLQDLPPPSGDDKRPVILVLGSEGYGLRTLVAKACTEFVRVPSGDSNTNDDDEDENEERSNNVGVDSLNVSVTGGILLWHLLHGASR